MVIRKLGQDSWKIAGFMECIKRLVEVRENCDYEIEEKQYDDDDKFTTYWLACMPGKLRQIKPLQRQMSENFM